MAVFENSDNKIQSDFEESRALHFLSLALICLVFIISLCIVLTIGESKPGNFGRINIKSSNFPLPVTPWD